MAGAVPGPSPHRTGLSQMITPRSEHPSPASDLVLCPYSSCAAFPGSLCRACDCYRTWTNDKGHSRKLRAQIDYACIQQWPGRDRYFTPIGQLCASCCPAGCACREKLPAPKAWRICANLCDVIRSHLRDVVRFRVKKEILCSPSLAPSGGATPCRPRG